MRARLGRRFPRRALLSRLLHGCRPGLLITLLLAWPQVAPGKVSVVPLPVYDTNPQEGSTFGFMPVFLILDEQDAVRQIYAPTITHNVINGTTGTFRLLGYPDNARRYALTAGASTGINYRVRARDSDTRFLDGRFLFESRVRQERDGTFRFFGFGTRSVASDETNYALRETHAEFAFGPHLSRHLHLTLREIIRRVEVEQGRVENVPFIGDRFPDIPGVRGGTVHAQRLALTYDSRDSGIVPTRGAFWQLYAEVSAPELGSSADYLKLGGEGSWLFPLDGPAVVLVLHGLLEGLNGTNVPFFARTSLGGQDTLRGFKENRFIGNARILGNAEARIRLFNVRLFQTNTEFELDPFLDMGQVFNAFKQISRGTLQVVPGVGLRALVRPTIVGRVDVAVGREGSAVFIALDYPF
ncbi:MAG: BamA/TamA family outer membrane protein [Deltaproteobacteria bacterium]|nr:BamA/TamA family outer membrane protein [Deltaproteobacteria bacterium]